MTDLDGSSASVSAIDGDGITGIVLRAVGGDVCRSTLGETGPAISDLVLLQCHFTSGDGEVDLNILAIAILDRQGRGTVEGVVVTVLDFRNLRGVDRDGVALGVGVISGNVVIARHAGSTGQIPVFFEITADAGHAGRQRVVDRAAGKTGGDIFGDRVESVLQPVEVTSRVGLAGGNTGVQIVEESDICICVRILQFLVGSTKTDGVERITHGANTHCLLFGRLEGFLIAVLAITIGISSYVESKYRRIMVVRSVIIGRLAVSQRDDVLRSCVGDSAVAKQVLSFDKALLQIGAAAGFQAVDSVHNSLIAVIRRNILPSAHYRCAVGKGNQCDKATRALAITVKEIDGRVFGRRKLSVITHRAGGIDDEHRCGLRVAGLGLGGRVHLHFQRDLILVRDNIAFCICCGYSGLADGINAFNGGDRISAVAVLVLEPSTASVIAVDYVSSFSADLGRQHVQRQ